MSVIQISAQGLYVVCELDENDHPVGAVSFKTLQDAIANCGYRGLKYALGWFM
jgi:hypothetical protein